MKQLFNSIKIIAIALIIGLGVSYVSAAPWAAPGATPTGGNTVASVNISDYAQTKIGSFVTDSFLKAGGLYSPVSTSWNKPGYAIAEKAVISPWSFFTSAFLPGSGSQVKIGGGDDATTDIFNTAVTPFTIDLAGRGSGNNSVSGRQVIDIRTDTSACYPNATIRTNTPAVELLNSKTGDNADAIVRGVQLSGGNPAPGKILVSTDSDGNAVWGTPTLSGGQIVFTYGTSPAATGQALCSTPPATTYHWDTSAYSCIDSDPGQPGIRTVICKDSNGNTVADSFCTGTKPATTGGICPACGTNNGSGISFEDDLYNYMSQTQFNNRDRSKDCSGGTSEESIYTVTSTSGPAKGYGSWQCSDPTGVVTEVAYCQTSLPIGGGCFTSGTMVSMADGSKKAIENINVGDKLKSVSGINTVKSLLRPKLGDQPVYSINGSSEFFTANHPFLTAGGWKSIDPEVTKREIPDLPVTKMTVGDVLVTDHGNVIIKSLIAQSASADTQLYNFELDGDHTYYANGYAVHNKYDMEAEACVHEGQVDPDNPFAQCNPYAPGFACTKDLDCRGYIGSYDVNGNVIQGAYCALNGHCSTTGVGVNGSNYQQCLYKPRGAACTLDISASGYPDVSGICNGYGYCLYKRQ